MRIKPSRFLFSGSAGFGTFVPVSRPLFVALFSLPKLSEDFRTLSCTPNSTSKRGSRFNFFLLFFSLRRSLPLLTTRYRCFRGLQITPLVRVGNSHQWRLIDPSVPLRSSKSQGRSFRLEIRSTVQVDWTTLQTDLMEVSGATTQPVRCVWLVRNFFFLSGRNFCWT